jgi:hypothetical protein
VLVQPSWPARCLRRVLPPGALHCHPVPLCDPRRMWQSPESSRSVSEALPEQRKEDLTWRWRRTGRRRARPARHYHGVARRRQDIYWSISKMWTSGSTRPPCACSQTQRCTTKNTPAGVHSGIFLTFSARDPPGEY